MIESETLIIPPRENVGGSIVVQKQDQKHEGILRRKSTADLLKDLNNTLQDAVLEITMAPRIYEVPGYRLMSYGRVSGMSPAEVSAWKLDLKKRYEAWRVHMMRRSPLSLSICVRVCQDEEPISVIRKQERMGQGRAIAHLQDALNEYCLLSGWGNQIEGVLR